MADGVKIQTPGIEKSMARLRKIAPNVDKYADAALKKNAEEYVKTVRPGVWKDEGDFAQSMNVDKSERGWSVKGLWYWIYKEHGTVKMSAEPYLIPMARLLRKRFKGRVKRAINKAVKEALK